MVRRAVWEKALLNYIGLQYCIDRSFSTLASWFSASSTSMTP